VLVIGAAADEVFADVEVDAALGAEPADDLFHLGHDFGADAIAGEDEKGGIGHGGSPAGLGIVGGGLAAWFGRVKRAGGTSLSVLTIHVDSCLLDVTRNLVLFGTHPLS